ncbi:MAG: hypothetical protein C4542_07190 [Dehalococcoidia bacterium]|nr:MAG: hypothetical protein C4542_07190 [Dehalococcoidia bacterium]
MRTDDVAISNISSLFLEDMKLDANYNFHPHCYLSPQGRDVFYFLSPQWDRTGEGKKFLNQSLPFVRGD